MMRITEFLSDETIYFTLFNEIDQIERDLIIVSPWLETRGHLVDKVVAKLNDGGVEVQVITRFYQKKNHKHRDAIFLLHDNGAKIHLNKILHAKMFIFDSKSLLLCSSNLIGTSLFRNHEVGLISRDSKIINEALGYCTWLREKSRLFRPWRQG